MTFPIVLCIAAAGVVGWTLLSAWTSRFAARSRLQLIDQWTSALLTLMVLRAVILPALAPVWLALVLVLAAAVAGGVLRWSGLPWDVTKDRSPRRPSAGRLVGCAIGLVITVGGSILLI